MAKILLVEDDQDLATMVVQCLTSEHHTVEHVANGAEGLVHIHASEYEVIILDLSLPDMSGLDVLRALRSDRRLTPVLILTGKKAVTDKEQGLDSGADDYLTKPFHIKELSARIRALMRRTSSARSTLVKVGDLVLDPVKYKVTKNGVEINLLPREFALLEFLMRHPDDVFSGEALLQRVWHKDSEASEATIRIYIMRLRQKIDADENNSVIETIPRVGYRLKSS